MTHTAAIPNARPEPPKWLAWTILLFISLAMFGNYYVYDSISPIADLLATQLNFNDSDIGLLQGIYSLPNVIMVLIGGMIIDRIGARLASIIFTILCFAGALITALTPELWMMATGRLIFGLGAESMIVAINTIIARWFKKKELAFAFGLNLLLARAGSYIALQSPNWGQTFYSDWQMPLIISVLFMGLSVLTVALYLTIDRRAEKAYNILPVQKQDEINIKEALKFKSSYWYIVILCTAFYGAIFPFQTFAIKFFQEFHGVSRGVGADLSSLITLSGMFLAPIIGLLSDKFGRRTWYLLLGSLFLVPVYLLLVFGNINLYIPMVLMSVAFSTIPAVLWPYVALIIEEKKLGTAYGLMTMIQNIGMAGMNFLIGWANDFSGGYVLGMYIFTSLAVISVIFAWLLHRVDSHKDAGLAAD